MQKRRMVVVEMMRAHRTIKAMAVPVHLDRHGVTHTELACQRQHRLCMRPNSLVYEIPVRVRQDQGGYRARDLQSLPRSPSSLGPLVVCLRLRVRPRCHIPRMMWYHHAAAAERETRSTYPLHGALWGVSYGLKATGGAVTAAGAGACADGRGAGCC